MRYVYEFIGTFFLMLTVGMVVSNPNHPEIWAPLAIGSILGVMVFAGAHISGGHYNPAVSLAVYLRRNSNFTDLWMYWAVQLAGAALAAFTTIYLVGDAAPEPLNIDLLRALLAEFLFTFALCYVVLNVATVYATAGNSYFGWAIGFTVLAGAYAVGAVSGGAFNPAVALGATILNFSAWSNLWVYLVGNLAGAALAALVVNNAHEGERREDLR